MPAVTCRPLTVARRLSGAGGAALTTTSIVFEGVLVPQALIASSVKKYRPGGATAENDVTGPTSRIARSLPPGVDPASSR